MAFQFLPFDAHELTHERLLPLSFPAQHNTTEEPEWTAEWLAGDSAEDSAEDYAQASNYGFPDMGGDVPMAAQSSAVSLPTPAASTHSPARSSTPQAPAASHQAIQPETPSRTYQKRQAQREPEETFEGYAKRLRLTPSSSPQSATTTKKQHQKSQAQKKQNSSKSL